MKRRPIPDVRATGAFRAWSAVAVFAWVAVFGAGARAASIVHPWRATTAIVKAGESFPVWFAADDGQTVLGVTLQGPYQAVTTSQTVQTGSWVYDESSGNRYNTTVRVTVPSGTPADRYDLVLRTSSGEIRSRGAVKVVRDFASEYYVLHVSDTHAFQHGYDDTLRKLSAIVEMANIIGPELVFETGDNLYRPTDAKMDQYFNGDAASGTKGFNGFSAATFIVCGNHDYDLDHDKAGGNYPAKSEWYNRWWGLQAYHFTYGDGRFIVINNGWEGFETAPQLAAAESWLQAVGPGNFRLAAAHIRNRKLEQLHRDVKLTLALLGHNHHVAAENPHALNDQPIQYIADSVRDHWEFNLFHVDGRTGAFVPVSGPTARVQVMPETAGATGPAPAQPNLTREFEHPNDGTVATNVATIVNRFDFDLHRARIRFVMPKGRTYSISQGTIDQAFDGETFTIVDASVDVRAKSAVAVSIASAARRDLPR